LRESSLPDNVTFTFNSAHAAQAADAALDACALPRKGERAEFDPLSPTKAFNMAALR
jgi:hypothetical protein